MSILKFSVFSTWIDAFCVFLSLPFSPYAYVMFIKRTRIQLPTILALQFMRYSCLSWRYCGQRSGEVGWYATIMLFMSIKAIDFASRCHSLPIHTHGRHARGKNYFAFGDFENLGSAYGWLLCLSVCTNFLVVWIRPNTWRTCVRKLQHRFASMRKLVSCG